MEKHKQNMLMAKKISLLPYLTLKNISVYAAKHRLPLLLT